MAARKKVVDAFFNPLAILRVISRWLLKDRTLLFMFLKMSFRNRVSERIMRRREYADQNGERPSRFFAQPEYEGWQVD